MLYRSFRAGPSNLSSIEPMKGTWWRWLRRASSSQHIKQSRQEDDANDMFECTSGRWIYNEHIRRAERRLDFDVAALRNEIAACTGFGAVISFAKVAEGGFNRIFQVTCKNVNSVLARLPYPSTVPKHYTVASEVATLEYLRLNQVPVPRVYGWSSAASNAVGAEYIIMQQIKGETLGATWVAVDFKERCKVIEQVVQLEKKLLSLMFPASGSLYFPCDLSEHEWSTSVSIHGYDHEFCVGPMAHYSWWHGERHVMELDRAPWHNSNDIFTAVGNRELPWTERFAKPRHHYERLYRKVHDFQFMQPQAHVEARRQYLPLAKYLGFPPEHHLSRPVLRHPDLQPNNIILSESLDIVGLVDWQHATIVPFSLAAGIPHHFQNYGDPESERLVKPAGKLPPDFDSLSYPEQAAAKDLHIKRLTHFLYAPLTLNNHPEHYDAIFDQWVILLQLIHKTAGSPWEGDSITLDAELITASRNPAVLALVSETQKTFSHVISYSDAHAHAILDQHARQQEMDTVMNQMRATLDVDAYGWTCNEDYETTKALAADIKRPMIQAAELCQRENISRNFPFDDDFDEQG